MALDMVLGCSFNCIVSGRAISIPEAKIAQESKKSDITDQAKTMTKQMDFLLQMIIGLGVIICIAAVYVAVNMLVSESRSNISMLKVLGSYLISILLTSGCYFGSLWLLRRKVKKVDMIESLKDNRE